MVNNPSSPKLDDLDNSLIRELDIDARQNYLKLAEKLSTSRNTVRRRLQRLLDEKIIWFVTVTSPPAFGYRTHATMAITVQPGDVDAVADKLKSFANIPYLLTTTGRYNIIAAAIFRNLDEMLDFLDTGLGTVSHLLGIEVIIGVNWLKFCLNPMTSINQAFPAVPPPRIPDELDLAIIRELETDPTQTNLDLVSKLGINRVTLSKRVQTLLDHDIIRVSTLVNPFSVGFQVHAVLLIKARPGRINSSATLLASLNEITHLIVTAGAYDMIAYAFFRDSGHMSEFIKDQMGRIDGIIRVETMLVLEIKKMLLGLLTLGLRPVQDLR